VPITLLTAPGPTANSFADLAYFKAYIATVVPQPEWATTATDEELKAVLVQAARVLSSAVVWNGVVSSADQSLALPRNGLFRFGVSIDGVLAPEMLNAQCELGVRMKENDLLAVSDAQLQGLTRLKAGEVELEFAEKEKVASTLTGAQNQLLAQSRAFAINTLPLSVRVLLLSEWYTQPSYQQPVIVRAGDSCNHRRRRWC
jgi:hypothetical protein